MPPRNCPQIKVWCPFHNPAQCAEPRKIGEQCVLALGSAAALGQLSALMMVHDLSARKILATGEPSVELSQREALLERLFNPRLLG